MKFTHIVAIGGAVAAIVIGACGNHNNTAGTTATTPPPMAATPPPPAMTTGQSLNTAAVLAQARATSETASPYAVNNGSLTITDTSEATGPINVN